MRVQTVLFSLLTSAIAVLFFVGTAAAQDAIAVMKLEPIADPDASLVNSVTEQVKDQIRKTDMQLSAQGGDVMLADIEFIIEDCDVTTNACLDQIADFFSAKHIIYGNVGGSGVPTTLIWYTKGEGEVRTVYENITSAAGAEALARKLIIGETGKLMVSTGSESGAEVLVDGSPVGLTPYEVEVSIGSHTVEVRKQCFLESSRRTVEIGEGKTANVEFALEVDESCNAEREMSTLTKVGWILTGIGGAALIGGTVTGVLVLQEEDAIKDKLAENDFAGAQDVAEGGETLALTTNILFGVGGTLAATGLTLVIVGLFESDGSETDEAASRDFDVDVIVGGDGALGTFTWRF